MGSEKACGAREAQVNEGLRAPNLNAITSTITNYDYEHEHEHEHETKRLV
jgi:hypothetical protein